MSCTYYRWNGGVFGDYWCDKKDSRVDEEHYRRYCRDYNYDECSIYNHTESSGPCFITTVLCNILGLSDDDGTLNTLRSFRDNVLQKDESYKEILMIYDAIGPMVADALIKDEKKHEKALGLYEASLKPIINEVKNENYERAVKHYLYMTLYLVSEYNLRNTYNALRDVDFGFTNFNQKTAGHGRVLCKNETA